MAEYNRIAERLCDLAVCLADSEEPPMALKVLSSVPRGAAPASFMVSLLDGLRSITAGTVVSAVPTTGKVGRAMESFMVMCLRKYYIIYSDSAYIDALDAAILLTATALPNASLAPIGIIEGLSALQKLDDDDPGATVLHAAIWSKLNALLFFAKSELGCESSRRLLWYRLLSFFCGCLIHNNTPASPSDAATFSSFVRLTEERRAFWHSKQRARREAIASVRFGHLLISDEANNTRSIIGDVVAYILAPVDKKQPPPHMWDV